MTTNQHECSAAQVSESALQSMRIPFVCIGLLMPLLILASSCGCRTARTSDVQRLSPQILLTIERGASEKKLETLLGVPARPEFTASRDSTVIRCVSYYFASYHLKYYFVLTNEALEKIILPPRFEHELSSWEHGKRAVWKSYDPQERMDVVQRAPDLDQQGITASIEHRYKPEMFDNALPGAIIAGVIAAPITIARTPQRIAEEQEIKSLSERFDPSRVRLGMMVAEVDQIFGAPCLSEKGENDCETRYYGSQKLGTQNPLLWVSVVFKGGKAFQVFSDDFFNYRKIEEMTKGKK